MSELFNRKPRVSWIAGDERKTPKGTSIGGIRNNSYWVTRLTEEETDSETWQLEDYIEKIYSEFSTKIKTLKPFYDSGGRLELYVSLYGGRNFGVVFNPNLLSRLGEAKIELLLDIYPE